MLLSVSKPQPLGPRLAPLQVVPATLFFWLLVGWFVFLNFLLPIFPLSSFFFFFFFVWGAV